MSDGGKDEKDGMKRNLLGLAFALTFAVGLLIGRISASPKVRVPLGTTTVEVKAAWPGRVLLESENGKVRAFWTTTVIVCGAP